MSVREKSALCRYYDSANRRLVYIREAATREMWDSLWMSDANAVRAAVTICRRRKDMRPMLAAG